MYLGADRSTGAQRRHRRRLAAAMVLALAILPAGLAIADPLDEHVGEEPIISVLSGRPDSISGGDALVQVDVPDQVSLEEVGILAAGRDQSAEFEIDEDERTLTGTVTDLPVGESRIEVDLPARTGAAGLEVTNHPQEGPIFSGPHEEPFLCETEEATVPVLEESLGAPLDTNCSIEDRVDYIYQNTDNEMVPWPEDATEYPEDLRRFESPTGENVPFIVRIETGTVNRAIFQTSVVHDPIAEDDPSPTQRPEHWSGGSIFMHGEGCPEGWYRQGAGPKGMTNTFMLTQGFALMSSSLNTAGNNCNDLLASETAMMVKEEFSERYGAPDHVIAFGSSGGSFQSLQTADNYPGIFGGLVIGASFPDVGFATTTSITDAKLLDNYFSHADTEWTKEEKRAVSGFLSYDSATNVAGDERTDPRANCEHLPEEVRYDPESNPGGARCDLFSHARNAYGTDPETGMPRRPMDNVGVQYGLEALNDGDITVGQFLDLNDAVGGLDGDSNLTPERTVGDTEAIRAAYRTGRLTSGGGGLAEVPIIDQRTYLDDKEGGELHLRYHTLSLRQRLIDANGTASNHVSLMRESHHPDFAQTSILQMDEWLRQIAADESDAAPIDKIEEHRPAELQDGCYLRDDTNTFVAEPLDRDPDSTCEQEYPSASFPREVAGAGIAADVAKCEVKAPDPADYDEDLSDEQWQRLQKIFDDGVCDYSRPGVEQQGLAGTWLSFDENGWITPDGPAGWSETETYHAGERVSYGGAVWEAAWWTRGEHPGETDGAWQEIAETADGTAIWTPSRVFTTGDVAEHDGVRYQAQWWTRNEEPGASHGPWRRE